jgi:B3 DNA binding domain
LWTWIRLNSITVFLPLICILFIYNQAIPAEFAIKHLPQQNKNAVLHYEGHTWSLSISYSKIYASCSSGWKQFVEDNNVQEGNLCLFELMDSNNETVSFKVHLSRN